MTRRARFPLMAKMLLWLLVHLGVLAAAFFIFVAWQLRLGLDSFLSGTAGERLKNVGEVMAAEFRQSPRREWPEILERHASSLGMKASLQLGPEGWLGSPPERIPGNVDQRMKAFRRPDPRPQGRPGRPPMGPPGVGPRGDGPPGDRDFEDFEDPGPPERRPPVGDERPAAQPVFLLRGEGGNGYWAGIDLPLFEPRRGQPLHGLLILRSDDLSGGGLFFDIRPWLLGGLAVLTISLILWAPVFFGITRYVSRLSRATEAIADGKFDVRVGAERSDELGSLGASIESMAGRLDRLVRGQKRFLWDPLESTCRHASLSIL